MSDWVIILIAFAPWVFLVAYGFEIDRLKGKVKQLEDERSHRVNTP